MRKEILTCDRCKKVVDHLEGVGAGKRVYQYSGHGHLTEHVRQVSAEWCLPCCIEVGFAKQNPKIPVPEVNPPTLEELIREILREEVERG